MANIAPFALKIGLPINLDLNDGQNKNKVHIFKVLAKIPNNWPKIGKVPLGHKGFKWPKLGRLVFESKVLGHQNNSFFKANRMVQTGKL